jgi:hypothetical protein
MGHDGQLRVLEAHIRHHGVAGEVVQESLHADLLAESDDLSGIGADGDNPGAFLTANRHRILTSEPKTLFPKAL